MIIELRTYLVQPAKVPEFFAIYEQEVLPVQLPILGNMIGYFATELGRLNEIVHLWGFADYRDRELRRERLAGGPHWQRVVARLHPIIVSMENKILIPAPFSPIGGLRPAGIAHAN